jgi:hypothetical protein
MSEYDAQITEIVEPTADDRATTRIARSVYWRGEAQSHEEAKAKAWDDWDRRYGPNRPAAIVNVTELTPAN